VRPVLQDEKSKQGILLTKVDEKHDRGTVLSVGDGAEVKRFKKNDIILFQRYGPAYVRVDREDLVIVHYDEILGKEV